MALIFQVDGARRCFTTLTRLSDLQVLLVPVKVFRHRLFWGLVCRLAECSGICRSRRHIPVPSVDATMWP